MADRHDADQVTDEAPQAVQHPFRAAAVVITAGIVMVLVMAGLFVRSTLRDIDPRITCRITAEGVAARRAANDDRAHATDDHVGTTVTADSGCAWGDVQVD